MEIPIKKLKSHAKILNYAHAGDAGADIYSAEDYVIGPGKQEKISTGVALAIPLGYAGLVWDKSGIATNHEVHTMAGVIDPTYRGELIIALKNLGSKPFKVERGMKIAQLLIKPVISAKFKEVKELEDTERGTGGFGSTGMK